MAELHQIIAELADSERLEALAITLRDKPQARLAVAPALTAARPAIVAGLALHAARPIVYVVHNGDAAGRAASDLCEWLGEDAVLTFPANDALPYEQMSPGAAVIAGRLRVLA